MPRPDRLMRRTWPVSWPLAAILALAVVWPALAQRLETGGPVNDDCPVMTEEQIDSEVTITYDGRTVAFGCHRCLAKFEANPDRYATRLAAFQAPTDVAGSEEQPTRQHTHEHGDAEQERTARQHGTEASLGEPAAAGDDHDHEHHHAGGEGLSPKLIAWFGKFHPPAVNFPIAMIIGSALAEILLIATGRSFFANAGRFCVWVGALGGAGAALLGWFFGGFHLVDDSWILTTHRWLGSSTAVWLVLVLVLGERAVRSKSGGRARYRAVLFMGAALVAVTGFFGGSLVYGLSHYAW